MVRGDLFAEIFFVAPGVKSASLARGLSVTWGVSLVAKRSVARLMPMAYPRTTGLFVYQLVATYLSGHPVRTILTPTNVRTTQSVSTGLAGSLARNNLHALTEVVACMIKIGYRFVYQTEGVWSHRSRTGCLAKCTPSVDLCDTEIPN